MNIVILLLTLFFGKKFGIDEFKNQYYYSKMKLFGRQRRWVIYKGKVEASKVPPQWDAWLRGMTDAPLNKPNYSWLKSHSVNLTGTKFALNPNKYNSKIKSYNDYTSWNPEESNSSYNK